MAAELKPLKVEMTVDTSAVDAALSGFVDAIKLADRHDSTGRRLTAVDELIDETIAGDAKLAILAATGGAAVSAAWEAVARDLARQVINAETEIAELDAVNQDKEDAVSEEVETNRPSGEWWKQYWEIESERDLLADRIEDEERAHCDTYIEAVRLSAELAGWQNSSHAEYRKATAATRLTKYRQWPGSPSPT